MSFDFGKEKAPVKGLDMYGMELEEY